MGRLGDLVERAELGHRAHREAELAAADRPAGAVRVRRLHRDRDVVGRESERTHLLRIDLDAHLVLGRAGDRDARDALDLLEPPRMHVGGRAAEEAQVVQPREADDRDGAFTRIAREERRALGRLWELAACLVEALADREHRRLHVGAPGEARRRHRLAVAAHAAQLDDPRCGGDRLLDRFGDEARDLLGGRPRVAGADGEHRERDVGEERDGESRERDAAEQDDREHGRDGRDGFADRRGGERHGSRWESAARCVSPARRARARATRPRAPARRASA
jgi:hypothetical protein